MLPSGSYRSTHPPLLLWIPPQQVHLETPSISVLEISRPALVTMIATGLIEQRAPTLSTVLPAVNQLLHTRSEQTPRAWMCRHISIASKRTARGFPGSPFESCRECGQTQSKMSLSPGQGLCLAYVACLSVAWDGETRHRHPLGYLTQTTSVVSRPRKVKLIQLESPTSSGGKRSNPRQDYLAPRHHWALEDWAVPGD